MRPLTLLGAAIALAAAAPTAPLAGIVGKPLPEVELEGFTKTPATALSDYYGRALLIEFFAYW